MDFGFIYILSNPLMPNILKIGHTTKSVDERAKELSVSTGVPLPFIVEYWRMTKESAVVEGEIHKELAPYRVSDNREFFMVDMNNAIKVVDGYIKEVPTSYRRCSPLQDDTEAMNQAEVPRDNSVSTVLGYPLDPGRYGL